MDNSVVICYCSWVLVINLLKPIIPPGGTVAGILSEKMKSSFKRERGRERDTSDMFNFCLLNLPIYVVLGYHIRW